MKRLFYALMVLAIVFTACNDNEVDVEKQKIEVGINILTESDNGLHTKTVQDSEFVDRGTTPACVRSLTIFSSHDNGLEEKSFNFTNPTLWWGYDGTGELDHTTRTVLDEMNMSLWAGNQTFTASTTSFTEDWYTDPLGGESDGVSSGGSTAEFIVNGQGAGSAQIASALRAIPPYATYETDGPVDAFIDIENPGTVSLNMITQHSRMIMTFEFAEGVNNYTANVTFPRFDANGNELPQKCPNRTFNQSTEAWYYWSNSEALDGTQVKPIIELLHEGQVYKTLYLEDYETENNECLLKAGIDVWTKVVIIEGSVKIESNDFAITYNWEDEDNVINL